MRLVPLTSVLLVLAGASTLLTTGCGREEEVRRYRAPKDPMWRMLGAIVPGKDGTWFFKVVGPADRVGAHKEEVLSFLRTLRAEDGQIKWTYPPGWNEDHAAGPGRQACIHFGKQDPKLEMTVVRLPGDGGGLVANINRWLDQLGLDRASDAEVAGLVKKVGGTNVEAQFVDLIGPTRPSGGQGMMARQAPEPPPSRTGEPTLDNVRAMFSFDRPPAWKENPNPDKGRIYEFHVDQADGSALVSFTIMGGEGGGLPANIDRWREQAGLEALGEQAVARTATPIKFVNTDAWLVEAIGKDRAILGVIALNPQFSMFLKMDGAPAVVAAQRATFVAAAQSFQMRGRHE
jgi:hypothetical protein